jgi:type IV pilus assembly protein PilW
MLNKIVIKKQCGFTMAELMIALVINSILVIGLIAAVSANLRHYNTTINTNRLNQQLETALDMMANDIRRAGYWENAYTDIGLDQNSNPFMANGVDISVNNTNSCILFAYDHSKNGSLPAISASYNDERYGYRLNGTVIQARPPGAAYDCSAAAGAWDNVTDANVVTITGLTFTLTTKTITTGPGARGIAMRSVDISVSGRLTSDATITNTLTQHVRLRNDKFIP